MSVEMVGILGVILMFVLMFLRVPIAISLAVPGIIGTYYLNGWGPLKTILNTIVWDHSASYTLSTIPMFVLMGELLFASGISNELFDFFRKWLGNLRGGLGIVTIGASAVFAAASGSSVASTGTIGLIASKEMKKAGYRDDFASGTVVAGGTLGILIPPSTIMVIYGILTETSIGKLLIAGIIPGIILTLFYMLTVYVSVRLQPYLAVQLHETSTWKEKFRSLGALILVFLLFLLVMGGMYLGYFSPTEAAGVGAFGAFLIALIRRKLTFQTFVKSLLGTLRTTSFIFAIILGAFILNYFLAITRLPILLAEFITSTNLSPLGVLSLIILMYAILGAVMDALAMIVITIPIVIPTLVALNFDLIWFGVILVLMVEMALITPPFGMNCFVLKGAIPELNLNDIFKGALRFVIPILLVVVILIAFPEIVLYLPNLMR